jgi:hypothetical protein
MKRGGSKMGYTAQFNLLSPCYKDGEQPAGFHMGGVKAKPTKKGKPTKKATKAKNPKKTKPKQKGGSSCGASPSVSEMGIVDKPASLEPTKSELAWDNRMKGGDPNLSLSGTNSVQVKPANGANLFNKVQPANGNLQAVVNSNNSPLNKIKNELFPTGTTPELVMKLIQTNKNLTNPSDSTYSFEIFYRLEGTNEIKKSVKSDITFGVFLKEYHTISGDVFPPPPKPNGQTKAVANTNANAKAKANANAKAKANANAKAKANANAVVNGTANAVVNGTANAVVNGTAKAVVNANFGF